MDTFGENKGFNAFLFFFVIITSFASTLFIINNEPVQGYENSVFMPLIYIFFFLIVFRGRISKDKPIFFIFLILLGYLRYVIHPSLVSGLGGYIGRSPIEPLEKSYDLAIILMILELFVVTFTVYFFERKNFSILENSSLSSFGLAYTSILLVFGIMLLLVNPKSLSMINFISPTDKPILGLGLVDKISVYYFVVIKQLFYVNLIVFLSAKYSQFQSRFYVIVGGVITLLNISVFLGSNRTDMIITSCVSLVLYIKLFGAQAKKFSLLLIPIIIIFFNILTSYRNYHKTSKNELVNLSDTIQIYTGGIYNVAIGVEVPDYFPESTNFKVLFCDIFRPMMGPNIFLKSLNVKYSNVYYNKRIWIFSDHRSQILPMVAHSYMFFGEFLSPLLSVLFLFIYYFLQKFYLKVKYIEVKYFLALSMARMGFMLGQNATNLINDISLNLTLLMFVCLLYKFLVSISKDTGVGLSAI